MHEVDSEWTNAAVYKHESQSLIKICANVY